MSEVKFEIEPDVLKTIAKNCTSLGQYVGNLEITVTTLRAQVDVLTKERDEARAELDCRILLSTHNKIVVELRIDKQLLEQQLSRPLPTVTEEEISNAIFYDNVKNAQLEIQNLRTLLSGKIEIVAVDANNEKE